MGFDISFHPISENQIQEWYFDALDNNDLAKSLAKKHKIDTDDEGFYENKYLEILKIGAAINSEKDFDSSHAYHIANIQGFFQEFFYIRGASFSFIENSIMEKYYTKWEEIIPKKFKNYTIYNEIRSNYYAGKYIPYNKVCQLLEDYENDTKIKDILNQEFSYQRIIVLLKALNFAKKKQVGILESDGVMEPNPLDLNESTCYSNLFNCDTEGPILYKEAAMEQILEIRKQQELKEKPVKEKANFWKKLFKK